MVHYLNDLQKEEEFHDSQVKKLKKELAKAKKQLTAIRKAIGKPGCNLMDYLDKITLKK